MTRRVGKLLGPRPGLLVGFAVSVAVILAGFAYVVVDSESTWSDAQAKARQEAEARFATEARISAQLTSSIFTSTSTTAQQAAAKTFGGATIDAVALEAFVKRSKLEYVAVLGHDGKLLAASAGAPASLASGSAKPSREVVRRLPGPRRCPTSAPRSRARAGR